MKNIYVVEDNACIREMIELLLIEEQYSVTTCANIDCFWEQMKIQIPDLIVMDMILPDGNGVDVCATLKSTLKTVDIPIMLMSAHNQLNNLKAKINAEDYINKPFDLNDFVNRVEHHLVD